MIGRMRRDHRPYWLKKALDRLNQLRVDRRVTPQLEQVGQDFRVMNPGHLQISGSGISVGDHVYVMALADSPVRISVFDHLGKIHIGSYSIVNPGVRITSANRISIGQGCLLAMNCYLSDADWHDTHARIYAPGNTAPITLEDNVWIGESAFVAKGVTMGENSIAGAYAVVTKDVAPNTIVAGNPARVVGEINPGEVVTREAMFNSEQTYETFEAEYFAAQLANNSLAGWLRSLLLPGKKD